MGYTLMQTHLTKITWAHRLYWGARLRITTARAAARVRAVRRVVEAGEPLTGKIAVITGAGAGIGRAMTTAFARAGATCVLLTIEPDEGADALSALQAQGFDAQLVVTDVRDEAQVRDAAAQIQERYGRIDVLVNNAGVFLEEDRELGAGEIRTDIIQRTLAVNVYGAVHVTTALLHLIPRGGRIINVSSVMGRSTFRYDGKSAAYRLSKAALNSYTRSLAADLQPRGIMVDCFHPGWVKTPLGGVGATIEPHEATHTPLYLATRPSSENTGLFWQDCRSMLW